MRGIGPVEYLAGAQNAPGGVKRSADLNLQTTTAGVRSGGATDGDNHTRPTASQLRCQRRQSIVLVVRPAEFAHHVTAFDVAGFAQTPTKCGQAPNVGLL